MSSSALRALFVSVTLACGACSMTMQPAAPHTDATAAAAAITSTPSPHVGCTPQHVTIYFTDVVQSDEPVATPLLDLMMNNVHACQQAGGTVRSVTVATTADPGQSAGAAAAQLQRRQERIRDTLVHIGLPSAKIGYAPASQADPDAIMGKHADITVDLY